MRCPICDADMELHRGENEALDGQLYPYQYYSCVTCDKLIWDWEDEFEWPEDK